MNSNLKNFALGFCVILGILIVTNGQVTNQYGQRVQPGPLVEYSNGVLTINRRVVDRCFWWDNGRYQLNRRNNEIFVNNRRIPDYFTHNLPGNAPPCPGHSGTSAIYMLGTSKMIFTTLSCYLMYKIIH